METNLFRVYESSDENNDFFTVTFNQTSIGNPKTIPEAAKLIRTNVEMFGQKDQYFISTNPPIDNSIFTITLGKNPIDHNSLSDKQRENLFKSLHLGSGGKREA